MQWHQLNHIQTICTLKTDNHTNTSSITIFTGLMLFLTTTNSFEGIKVFMKSNGNELETQSTSTVTATED